jgi:hypothetical protein
MHLRRVASFVLGAWIVGSLFALYIASQSGIAAEKVVHFPPPELRSMIQTLGTDKAASLLHYHGAEQSRAYVHDWGRLQLLLGPALLLILAFATRISRLALGLCGAMIVFAAFSSLILVPEIDYLERGLEFASGWSANRARYLALRGTFTVLETLKMTLGFALAAYLFLYKTRRFRAAVEEAEVGETAPQTDH